MLNLLKKFLSALGRKRWERRQLWIDFDKLSQSTVKEMWPTEDERVRASLD